MEALKKMHPQVLKSQHISRHLLYILALLLGFLPLLFEVELRLLNSNYPLMQSNLIRYFVLRNIINVSISISNSDSLLLNSSLIYTTASSPSGCLRYHKLIMSKLEFPIPSFPPKNLFPLKPLPSQSMPIPSFSGPKS